jgi:hypothetical protein
LYGKSFYCNSLSKSFLFQCPQVGAGAKRRQLLVIFQNGDWYFGIILFGNPASSGNPTWPRIPLKRLFGNPISHYGSVGTEFQFRINQSYTTVTSSSSLGHVNCTSTCTSALVEAAIHDHKTLPPSCPLLDTNFWLPLWRRRTAGMWKSFHILV